MRWTLLLGLLAVLGAAADTPPPADEKKAAPLPSGAIVIIADTLEALKLMPKGVWLSQERHQQLLDAEKKLKEADKPRIRTPSKCALKGKVEGGWALVQATFDFDTEKAGTFVRLACGQGSATAVSLDGKTPALVPDPGKAGTGFAIEVDKPGDHQLVLDLVVPLAPRPGGQGLVLDLPRTAITSLDFTLPPRSNDVRLNGKTPVESRVTLKGDRMETDSLGPVEKIDVGWRSKSAATASAVLAADGAVTVSVKPGEIVTEAQLTLQVRAGQTQFWPLLVPLGAEVEVDPLDAPRVERIDKVDQKPLQRSTIRLKESSADTLHVTVRTRTPTPGPGKPVALGPFTVVNVAGQSGTIRVSNAAPDLHLDFTPHGDLRRRALTDEEVRKAPTLIAAFAYGPAAAPNSPWLDLETGKSLGQLSVKPAHTLRLADDGDPAGPLWLIETELTVTPRKADIDHLLVHLPEGYKHVPDVRQISDRIQSVLEMDGGRNVKFILNRAAQGTAPFTAKLVCRVPLEVDLKREGAARLALPRPVGIVEEDSVVRVVAPPSARLVPADNPSGLELIRQTTHELLYRCPRRPPEAVAVAWGEYRPSVEVSAVIDVTLRPAGVARVHTEFEFTAPDGIRALLPLDVPDSIAAGLSVRPRLEGRTLLFRPPGKLTVEYDLTAAGDELVVPLVVPEQVARVETKVRLWGEGGRLPTKAPAGWIETNIEEVPGRPRLPVMVLRSARKERSLRLDLGADDPTSRVLIERALARVELTAGGPQEYRVGYRVARLAGPWIDLELPFPAAVIAFQAALNGKIIDPLALPAPADRPELKGKLVRLKLPPDLVRGPAVLEVSYQLSADRQNATPVTTTLQVPQLRDEGAEFPVRWQIVAPDNWVILGPEPAPGVPRAWGRSGWWFAPRVGLTTADLDRWLTGVPPPDAEEAMAPSAVLWRETDGLVTLTHAPRQWWLISCSALLVLFGLIGMRLAWGGPDSQGSRWAWPVALLTVVAALLVVLFLPGLAALIAYGVQPGLIALVVIIPAEWLRAERRRRQVVFLANFSRSKTPSSLERPAEPPPEKSTVDVPRARGSSLERQGS